MTIEVRQLIIKSTVLEKPADNRCDGRCPDTERLKSEVLSEAKQMFLEIASEMRER